MSAVAGALARNAVSESRTPGLRRCLSNGRCARGGARRCRADGDQPGRPAALAALAGLHRACRTRFATIQRCGAITSPPAFHYCSRTWRTLNPALIARAVLPLARALHARRAVRSGRCAVLLPRRPRRRADRAALGLPLSIKARGSDIHLGARKPGTRGRCWPAAAQAGGLLAVPQALAATTWSHWACRGEDHGPLHRARPRAVPPATDRGRAPAADSAGRWPAAGLLSAR